MMRILQELLPPKLRQRWRAASLVRRAEAAGQAFHCRALAGESDYNICINSDLSVSCNCQDFSGQGRLGDLNTETLEAIFSGPTAGRFRSMLAQRSLPTATCAHCSDLVLVQRDDAQERAERYRVPYKGIMVENTVHCNLRCPVCSRQELLKLRGGRPSLSLAEVEQVALTLQRHGIRNLMYFNLGEPLLPPDIHEQLRVIRRHNPEIRIVTSTNGQLLGEPGRLEAALMMDYLYISLDGTDDATVGKYQVGGSFQRAYRNMAALVEERNRQGLRAPLVEWKYVVFRWNDRPDQLARARELARQAGVDVLGLYRGDIRLRDRSLRWYLHPYFKELGPSRNGGYLLNLNNVPDHLLSP